MVTQKNVRPFEIAISELNDWEALQVYLKECEEIGDRICLRRYCTSATLTVPRI